MQSQIENTLTILAKSILFLTFFNKAQFWSTYNNYISIVCIRKKNLNEQFFNQKIKGLFNFLNAKPDTFSGKPMQKN